MGEWQIASKIQTVLFTSQVIDDSSVQHIPYTQWVIDTVRELLNRNKQIIFRYHPDFGTSRPIADSARWNSIKRFRRQMHEFENDIEISNGNLYHDFERSDILVTFNSNTGVDATIWGLPNIYFDDGSMVKKISGKGLDFLDNPLIIDRRQWLCDLCFSQWSLFEIKHGRPQERLLKYLNE